MVTSGGVSPQSMFCTERPGFELSADHHFVINTNFSSCTTYIIFSLSFLHDKLAHGGGQDKVKIGCHI